MKIILFILMMTTSVYSAEQDSLKKSIIELASSADMSCMKLQVLGACPKPSREPPIGIKVKYWQPEVFVETVKMPGDYVISEYGSVLGKAMKHIAKTELEISSKVSPLIISSTSASSTLTGSNLQFSEAHVYDFPLSSVMDTLLCSDNPNSTLGVRYLTEMDAVAWRTGSLENKLPPSLAAPLLGSVCFSLPLGAQGQCMKNWGALYPRVGFLISPSELIGSIVNAVRSVSIAGDSLPFHILESKLDFQPNLPIDKIQMVFPRQSACFALGEPESTWGQGQRSKDGRYVWIYWHQRQCCV